MTTTIQSVEITRRKISELHDYMKHTLQQLVVWFSFFVTINYGTMGWLAVAKANSPMTPMIQVVALVFIIQNCIGFITIFSTRASVVRAYERLAQYETSISKHEGCVDDGPTTPINLYKRAPVLMAAAIAPVLGAWIIILFSR